MWPGLSLSSPLSSPCTFVTHGKLHYAVNKAAALPGPCHPCQRRSGSQPCRILLRLRAAGIKKCVLVTDRCKGWVVKVCMPIFHGSNLQICKRRSFLPNAILPYHGGPSAGTGSNVIPFLVLTQGAATRGGRLRKAVACTSASRQHHIFHVP